MQVRINATADEWHRPMLDPYRPGNYQLKTACKKPFGSYYATRDETLRTGTFCPVCFTADEIQLAAEFAAYDADRQAKQAERDEAERQESMSRALEESRERVRRAKTGQTAPLVRVEPPPDDDPSDDDPSGSG